MLNSTTVKPSSITRMWAYPEVDIAYSSTGGTFDCLPEMRNGYLIEGLLPLF
ncbi:MAG: hypothetical protein JXA49_07305 [Actinobacteria bacterium]|nr:hypothetical protein [Actinomycetota bacterium]